MIIKHQDYKRKQLDDIINKTQIICITDIDGTYLDTNKATRYQQVKALAKISGKNTTEINNIIEEEGLVKAVNKYMSLDEFFKNHYETFDPIKAAENGSMKVFPDAIEFTKSGIPTIAISNSTQEATENKLKALKIINEFIAIYAEIDSQKSKPNIYLAEKAIKDLETEGWYNPKQTIVHVGDQEYDIQFGNNIKTIHHNTINILIEREKPYRGTTKPDIAIKSFSEIYKLI